MGRLKQMSLMVVLAMVGGGLMVLGCGYDRGAPVDVTPPDAPTITSPAVDSCFPSSTLATEITCAEGSCEERLDGAAWQPCNTGFIGVAHGSGHLLEARCTDTCGNISALASSSFEVDVVPPTVDVDPLAACDSDGDVTVSATCADIGSGVASCEVSIDGGASWQPSPNVYVGLGTGIYSAFGQVTDNCGNSALDSVGEAFEVDTVEPVVSINTPTDGECIASSTVSVDASSDGGELVSCTIDGGSSIVVPGSWVLVGEGPHTIAYSSTDICGNDSLPVSVTVTVDTVVEVTIIFPEDGDKVGNPWVGVGGIADTDVLTVTVTTDQGLPGEPYSLPVEFDGSWWVLLMGVAVPSITITVQGTDNCGNIGSDSVWVDTTGPT